MALNMMASRALATMNRTAAGLVVHEENMTRNLKHPNVLGQRAVERLMMAVYKKTGQRDKTHAVWHHTAIEGDEPGFDAELRSFFLKHPEVTLLLPMGEDGRESWTEEGLP
jgi:adenylosuccinate lyase